MSNGWATNWLARELIYRWKMHSVVFIIIKCNEWQKRPVAEEEEEEKRLIQRIPITIPWTEWNDVDVGGEEDVVPVIFATFPGYKEVNKVQGNASHIDHLSLAGFDATMEHLR